MNHSLIIRTILTFSLSVPSFVLSQAVSTLPHRESREPSPGARQETIYRVLNDLGIELHYVEQRALYLLEQGEYNQAKNVCDELWNKVDTLSSSINNDSTLTKDDIQRLLARFKHVQKGIERFVSDLPPSDSQGYLLHREIRLPNAGQQE